MANWFIGGSSEFNTHIRSPQIVVQESPVEHLESKFLSILAIALIQR